MSGSGPIYEYQRELTARLEHVTRERDAYKKAKEENDERFMRERDEARAEVERLRASVENLDKLYASRTDSLRECEADVELWKQEAEQKQADFAMWFRLANDERKVTNRLRSALEDFAEYDCSYGDNCPSNAGTRHGTCVGCKARRALESK